MPRDGVGASSFKSKIFIVHLPSARFKHFCAQAAYGNGAER